MSSFILRMSEVQTFLRSSGSELRLESFVKWLCHCTKDGFAVIRERPRQAYIIACLC